jgi:murein DD-endopeptidase MepM/ murein hydrolase activator NlpD
MQILITHGSMARTRVLHLPRWKLLLGALLAALVLMLTSGAVYHYFFLQAAREGWPVVSQLVRWVVREDLAQRERYMRENLDAMAHKVGEMQARVLSLQMMGERVSGLAGVKAEDLKPAAAPTDAAASAAPGTVTRPRDARGGPFRPLRGSSLDTLNLSLAELDERLALNADVFTLIESRLLESRLQALLVPSSRPVEGPVGSGFGFRYDPFNGRQALHTGLDFPAEPGTPILAAAGGVVQAVEWHPEYGRLLVLDHGNQLVTRYAHLSQVQVAVGDLVRRRQKVAEVGNTGRSTGPHLHFEVLVQGVPQNPARFLVDPTTAAAPVRVLK